MDPFTQKAFEFAADMVKLFISLSTGLAAFSVTFGKEPANSRLWSRIVLVTGAGLCLLSATAGMGALMAMTGSLDPMTKADSTCVRSINCPNIRLFVAIQIALFLLGGAAVVIHGAARLFPTRSEETRKAPPGIFRCRILRRRFLVRAPPTRKYK